MSNTTHSETIYLTNAQKIRRICSIVVPLCFFSIILAAAIVSVANDMYAFVKPDTAVSITLDSPKTVYSAAKTLSENGIINNPAVFSLYVRTKGAEEKITSFSGEIYLCASMSYRQILKSFS